MKEEKEGDRSCENDIGNEQQLLPIGTNTMLYSAKYVLGNVLALLRNLISSNYYTE